MAKKPKAASEYLPEYVDLVRSTCLYVATKLGDMMEDVVVVGGLVPSLLIDQTRLLEHTEAHVGTMDLDLGLTLALFAEARYRTLTERLRAAGFSMDVNDGGNPTRQRWKVSANGVVTIDFLIEASLPDDKGGTLRNFEPDFAAIIAPGLHLAFVDRLRVTLEGETIMGEKTRRAVSVCGPAAFIVLKALAFENRGENKDAYDLYYMLRNYGSSLDDVVARLRLIRHDPNTDRALDILRRDFADPDALGPRRVARFIEGKMNEELTADVAGYVAQFLARS